MNIIEIAKRAKVSVATVSRTLNRLPTVQPKLAKRVWRVVKDCDYFPNGQARALVLGRSRTFGVVSPEIVSPFFASIIEHFERIAAVNGYEILLAITGYDQEKSRGAVRRMIERRVDGIALLTSVPSSEIGESCHALSLPLVHIDLDGSLDRVTSVRVDYSAGIRQAVHHLAALRHRKIAFVARSRQLPAATARRKAFEKWLNEIGLAVIPQWMLTGENDTPNGRQQLFSDFFQLVPMPTAVVCSDDLIATGLLQEASRRGVVVPKDLSVVGIENLWVAERTVPQLTTVLVAYDKIAAALFSVLRAQFPESDSSGREFALPAELILRDSTALLASPGARIAEK
jgi:DNA-binding LacI/PurR family transcriptional regulator